MALKQIKTNDVNFLKKLISEFFESNKDNSSYVKNLDRKIFSRKGFICLENNIIEEYSNRKKEIVNLEDFDRAFKDLGYLASH